MPKKMNENIPFNRPYMTGKELQYIVEAKSLNILAGDGVFTRRCHEWLEQQTGCAKALLTHSCTAALEMSALLMNIQAGDEIIMPSFTFVSTANAYVLRGGVPVFVDVRSDTLNINERLIEEAITSRTKAIVVVHYAGVACEMDSIKLIARRYGLIVVEDAAQGVMSSYKKQALGSIGDFGTFSFHETKNVIAGEGGALLINQSDFISRAEIIREKGTDRSRFFRGEVDKYTWREMGSSFLPGEITAAFLLAQLECAKEITLRRLAIWNFYHIALEPLETKGFLRRPIIPVHCQHNAHMYYILLSPEINRHSILAFLKNNNINAVFHYIPLHSSPAGQRYGRSHGSLKNTEQYSERLIRLPLWIELTIEQQNRVVECLLEAFISHDTTG